MPENKVEMTMQHIEAMISKGWSAAAIAKLSGVNQITVGNLRRGKASRVTDKVSAKIAALRARIDAGNAEMPRRGRKAAAGKEAAEKTGATTGPTVPRAAGTVETGKSAWAAAQGQDVAMPKKRGRKPGSKSSTKPASTGARKTDADFTGMINTRYVPVDIERLQGMIDQLIARFTAAAEELESIKSQLKI